MKCFLGIWSPNSLIIGYKGHSDVTCDSVFALFIRYFIYLGATVVFFFDMKSWTCGETMAGDLLFMLFAQVNVSVW